MKKDKKPKQKNKSYLFRNLGYALNRLWKLMGVKAYTACISDVLLGAAFPFLGMALPSAVVALLLSGRKSGEILLLLTGYLVLFQGVRLLQTWAAGRRQTYLFSFRNNMAYEYVEKALHADVQFLESEEGRKKQEDAGENLYNGNSVGIEAFLTGFFGAVSNLFGMAVYAVIIGSLNPLLLLLLAVLTLLVAAANAAANQFEYKVDNEKGGYWEKEWENQSLQKESIKSKNGKEIRLYRMKGFFLSALERNMWERIAIYKRSNRGYRAAKLLELLIAFLRDAVVYWYLIDSMLQGKIELSAFLLYVGAVSGFGDWLGGMVDSLQTMLQNNKHTSRYLDYMQSGIVGTEGKKLPEHAGGAHEIRLENVCFRYEDAKEDVLHNVNLTIHAGEKLALVGVNGAGKTTLIKIISGLYKPTAGKVYLDGQDVSKLNPLAYYKEFSVVFQDIFAFAFSLADNVSCKTPEDTDASRLEDCLKKADLWEKVQSLEKGVQTSMNKDLDEEGIILSGGEMQKLMLARALYKDAPVVILDEPTAALDPIAESEMYEKYHALTEDKTSIFISHRLSSTRFCNRILFLEDGEIKEEGSHEELMAKQGAYANMFTMQARYYQKEQEKGEECYA